jgi:mannan endo-1,4-beta-mannosidase
VKVEAGFVLVSANSQNLTVEIQKIINLLLMLKNTVYSILLLMVVSITSSFSQDFVMRKGSHFEIAGKPYYYIGTNFWYGAIIASKGEGGDRKRLAKELDFLKSKGIDNLRIMVGGDGPNGVPTRIEPTLQVQPGVYNDTIFDGLDFLLKEMSKRKMYAVLFLNNSWEWSGGYSQYLNWAGYGPFPLLSIDGWNLFSKYVAQYAECQPCHEMFKKHIQNVITRTNRYTGKKYIDDPAIMAWQIGNEPRVFKKEAKPAFISWLKDASAYIKSIDPNHLLSIGSEGEMGSEGDIALWETIHTDPNIDYTTIHIWPDNWSWINKKSLGKTLPKAISLTNDYLQRHLEITRKIGKPLVVEEFGFPRDSMQFTPQSPTRLRDCYYSSIFDKLTESAIQNDAFAGCNFWAWGGYAIPKHIKWKKGDDYMGDPSQEEQGLNSVFVTDSTVTIIEHQIISIQKKLKNH